VAIVFLPSPSTAIQGKPFIERVAAIDGITAFGPSAMTIRTSTRVRPGHHETIAAALRMLINETFDAQPSPRTSLIGEHYSRHVVAHR